MIGKDNMIGHQIESRETGRIEMSTGVIPVVSL